MKLLIVDNGWVCVGREGIRVSPRVREFLLDCTEYFDARTYLCSSPSHSLDQYCGVPLDRDLVRVVSVPARGRRRWARLLSYLCNFGVVWRAIRESDFLYVSFPGNVPLCSVGVSRLLRKPYGVYLRGELGRNSWWWRWTMSGARFVIAEGEVLADAARRFCDDVELAVPMCPLPRVAPDRKKSIRMEGPWRLLYVGRLEERKGTPELLEAMVLLNQRGIDCRLDLVGQDYLDRLPEHVAILGDRIHCVGVVTDDDLLGRYYAAADLFCLPSHDEGFPRVLYEAMIHGVPIVTTFVGSIAGIMKDGVNCLRVDVRSPVALADTIERALADAELRRRLCENGRATMEPICRQSEESSHAKQLASKIAAHQSHNGNRSK
ncbi:MAG: glycosyltransferase family 4 protein [Planctomycetes bacterium]|nr:glycosyltransferase family 4 protein [Planctomycetota bacterium]